MDPQLLQQLLAFLQSTPQSVSGQAKQTNYQQDQLQSLQNPLMTALLGNGGGFDPKAFDPVQVGQDTFDVPSDPLAPYLQFGPNSEEGLIATSLQQGLSPEQIVQKAASQGGAYSDPKALDRVRSTANQMFKENVAYQNSLSTLPGYDPQSGQWSPPEGGQVAGGKLVVPKYGPSELTQTFDKYGIPTPNTQFTSQDYGYDPQSLQSGVDTLAQQVAALRSQAGQSKAQSQRATAARTTRSARSIGMPNANTATPAQYTQDVRALRGAEKQLADQSRYAFLHDQGGTDIRNNWLAKHGITPTSLAFLQRAQGLQQLGG